MEQNLGIKVRVTYHPDSSHYKSGTKYEEFRNTTEIHYNYRVSQFGCSVEDWMKRPEANVEEEVMIAFESDVHHTGYTMPFSEILEFDTWPESEKVEHM